MTAPAVPPAEAAQGVGRVVEVLRGARDIVAHPRGWIQGAYSIEGRCCAMGAMMVASKGDEEVIAAAECFERALGRRQGSIIGWNDQDDRTQEEVVAMFDLAIAKATGK